MHFGEWAEIAQSEDHTREVARELVGSGLLAFANALCALEDLHPERTWTKEQTLDGDSGAYPHFFSEAIALEQRARPRPDRSSSEKLGEVAGVRLRLANAGKAGVMLAIDQTSARDLLGLVDEIRSLVKHDDRDVAWNARRALRRLGRGSLDERRLHPAPWHPPEPVSR